MEDVAFEMILAKLDKIFPQKNLLNGTDVMRYTGLTQPTVAKKFGLTRGKGIDKITLALMLSGGAC